MIKFRDIVKLTSKGYTTLYGLEIPEFIGFVLECDDKKLTFLPIKYINGTRDIEKFMTTSVDVSEYTVKLLLRNVKYNFNFQTTKD